MGSSTTTGPTATLGGPATASHPQPSLCETVTTIDTTSGFTARGPAVPDPAG